MDFADETNHTGTTMLSEIPMGNIPNISRQPGFGAVAIRPRDFEVEEVAMPPNLVGRLKDLGLRSSSELFAKSVGRLGQSFEAVRKLQAHPTEFLDVSVAPDDEVRSWLSALVADAPPSVVVVWLADRTAAEVPFSVLLERYDDLWYPSMDDVVVIFPNEGLLLMDHEEIFCFGHVVTDA